MPKISVIIPVYNVENYIEKCLDSVVNQTLKDIEIIIVNDGSQDSSKEKIEKYLKNYKDKIKYLEKTNGGLSSSRNYGMKYATGEYIAFLDSDDYIDNTAYEEMYKMAQKQNADMVECDFLWEYPKKIKKDIGKIYSNKKEMVEVGRVVAWNKIIKKEIIDKAKIEFPLGLRYEDVEFFYKIILHIDKVGFVKKPFIHYVQRESSIANTQNIRTKEIFQVLDNVISYYKEKGEFDKYYEEIEYNYVRILLCRSLKRMCKIENKKERKQALKENWENINKNFPRWRKNTILKKRGLKNIYIRSNNKITYKIYCLLLSHI